MTTFGFVLRLGGNGVEGMRLKERVPKKVIYPSKYSNKQN